MKFSKIQPTSNSKIYAKSVNIVLGRLVNLVVVIEYIEHHGKETLG